MPSIPLVSRSDRGFVMKRASWYGFEADRRTRSVRRSREFLKKPSTSPTTSSPPEGLVIDGDENLYEGILAQVELELCEPDADPRRSLVVHREIGREADRRLGEYVEELSDEPLW